MNELNQPSGKVMTNAIGQSIPRIDAPDKVTGAALYSGDLIRPGMLHMKILFSSRAHARVINIDISAAKALPGVVAVLTAMDVPVNEYGLQKKDQPVLCGPSSDLPEEKMAGMQQEIVRGDIVRCECDQVPHEVSVASVFMVLWITYGLP